MSLRLRHSEMCILNRFWRYLAETFVLIFSCTSEEASHTGKTQCTSEEFKKIKWSKHSSAKDPQCKPVEASYWWSQWSVKTQILSHWARRMNRITTTISVPIWARRLQLNSTSVIVYVQSILKNHSLWTVNMTNCSGMQCQHCLMGQTLSRGLHHAAEL